MGKHIKQTDLAELRFRQQVETNPDLTDAYEAIAALYEQTLLQQKELAALREELKTTKEGM
ncbi:MULTISPECIES: hypothetical protein [Brevibacillus]|jgi:hypothetical protein|uniref:hypothetical protein n=1 Tax=Brevibacillus TaxID=55080 RepID=UPI000F082C2F|nr:hypothetical protein [Brevibacillus borstelensis]MED1745723.1 hypothetical protein [Brevibacillus borstelensis]MED1883070.1 hypothetical protein [Brevibacillus borstelensis]MED2008675.1 hypothetical protein [Brevibacillus borstelensis]RNB55934.1 hypothetical protein EDM54_24500 [Brevibacillus borstelensis]GED54916.1 hypothetical protein BBO01nite_41570 [Brevibacillus borstelensis]